MWFLNFRSSIEYDFKIFSLPHCSLYESFLLENFLSYGARDSEFFHDFSFECYLSRFSFIYLPSWTLPLLIMLDILEHEKFSFLIFYYCEYISEVTLWGIFEFSSFFFIDRFL